MAEEITSNSYEEARKQQLIENKKRFEDLGILNISKSLSNLSKSEKKFKQREVKPKMRNSPITEVRRSSRAHNPIVSYQDEFDMALPTIRRSKSRSTSSSSWTSYLARPLQEVKMASNKLRVRAIKSAEKLQSNLQSEYPSFVKSMVRSHVYSCFWLALPQRFCEAHLPKSTVNMTLEDEDGNECEAVFIGSRTGLSGGWRAFALDHKLDDGDALVFELVDRARFKIYIVKAALAAENRGQPKTAKKSREEADETEKQKTSKKHKRTLDSPAENKKNPAAENQGQPKKAKKSKEEADETEKRKTSKKHKKTLDSPAENKNPDAENRSQPKKVKKSKEEADETEKQKTSKKHKRTLDSPAEKKNPAAESRSQPKKAKKSKEPVSATRRSARNQDVM